MDDDPLVSMSTADMLMDLGHSVTEASSGMEALQILEADPQFDLVVTDYAMPGMTGLDLASKIKQLRPHMPIIIATGYAELPPDAPSRLFAPGQALHPGAAVRNDRRRVTCPDDVRKAGVKPSPSGEP